jgi:hypothetical protein
MASFWYILIYELYFSMYRQDGFSQTENKVLKTNLLVAFTFFAMFICCSFIQKSFVSSDMIQKGIGVSSVLVAWGNSEYLQWLFS